MYKYLRGSENQDYVRACLSPEGSVISIQTGDKWGVNSEQYIWAFDPKSYNFTSDFDFAKSIFAEFGITEIPKPLPLPAILKGLLKRKLEDFLSQWDYDSEWVHAHFTELYENGKIEIFPLWEGDENGAIYIEPTDAPGVVLFCGRGSLACYYELDLNSL